MLTFDEFLSISPCTVGKHSTRRVSPIAEPLKEYLGTPSAALSPESNISTSATLQPSPSASAHSPPAFDESTRMFPPQESDSDDPSLPVLPDTSCRRRGCNATSNPQPGLPQKRDRSCNYHPGFPLFHEGSKGWTCCKRRVLEFDEFMRIQGCEEKANHRFQSNTMEKDENILPLLNVR